MYFSPLQGISGNLLPRQVALSISSVSADLGSFLSAFLIRRVPDLQQSALKSLKGV